MYIQQIYLTQQFQFPDNISGKIPLTETVRTKNPNVPSSLRSFITIGFYASHRTVRDVLAVTAEKANIVIRNFMLDGAVGIVVEQFYHMVV